MALDHPTDLVAVRFSTALKECVDFPKQLDSFIRISSEGSTSLLAVRVLQAALLHIRYVDNEPMMAVSVISDCESLANALDLKAAGWEQREPLYRSGLSVAGVWRPTVRLRKRSSSVHCGITLNAPYLETADTSTVFTLVIVGTNIKRTVYQLNQYVFNIVDGRLARHDARTLMEWKSMGEIKAWLEASGERR